MAQVQDFNDESLNWASLNTQSKRVIKPAYLTSS